MDPLSASPFAPTAMMPPSALTDTDCPNPSPAAPSDASSLTGVGVDASHPPVGLVNMYIAPASLAVESSLLAPTTTVPSSALTDTDCPNPLPPCKSPVIWRKELGLLSTSTQPPVGNLS